MSIAAAIIISTLLLITAWQLERRGAWSRLGKFAGILVLVSVAAVAALAGWLWWESGSDKRIARETLRALGDGRTAEYAGLSIGLEDKEVIYRKGDPDQTVYSKTSSQPRPVWVYSGDGIANGAILVSWGYDLGINSITCIGESSLDCPAIGGVYIGASEAEVTDAFGPPLFPPQVEETDVKRLCFGQLHGWVRFLLAKDEVKQIAIGAASDCSKGGYAIATDSASGAKEQRNAVMRGEFRDYWALSLGMTVDAVRAAKGGPDFEFPNPGKRNPSSWMYSQDFGSFFIDWGTDSRVKRITCTGSRVFHCPKVGGAGIGDAEASVLRRFGQPLYTPTTGESGTKLCFGTRDSWVSFVVDQGVVRWIAVGSDDCRTGGFQAKSP
jgi:hypothetical protein